MAKAKAAKAILVLAGAALFFGLAGAAFALTADELKQSIDERTKALQEINEKIQVTQVNLNATEAKSKNLNQEIRNFDYRISQLNLGVQSSKIKIEKLGFEITALAYDIEAKEEAIAVKKEAITNFLRQLQEKDRENTLIIFLKNKSLAESMSESQAISNLNERLREEIIFLSGIKDGLASALSDTEKKKSAEEVENRALLNKKAYSEEQKSDRKELLSATKNQEKVYQSQLSELEKKQAEIGAEIESIEQELRKSFDVGLLPVKRPGVLAIPLPRPAHLTQKYGATGFAARAYSSKFHNGADFGAPLGTPVFAAREGRVSAVGNNGRYQYGKYIVIEHDNGLSTLYAHLSGQAVRGGETVSEGALIGYVGNTGYSFGNHLHFTVYWTPSFQLKAFPACNCGLVPVGVTIDPFDYLERI